MQKRIAHLRRKLSGAKVDALFVSSVASIGYLTGYFNFSKSEREAYLLITKSRQYIFTDKRYAEAIKKLVSDFELVEISPTNPLTEIFKNLSQKHSIKTLGFEEDNLTVLEFNKINKFFSNLKPIQINTHRSIKDAQELKYIKTACEIGDRAFDFIITQVKIGISEKELAFKLESFIKQQGADLSFAPIVAFGKNSSIPHHQTGNAVLENLDGQFILLDFGARFENYCSDMTRTIFYGKPNKKQRRIYRVVLEAQKRAIDYINSQIKEGRKIKCLVVDRVSREYILSQGFPNIPHSLGHGIGLEVHEQPFLSSKSQEILKSGVVFSIEPGMYLPKFGGVRIEDLFVLEKTGLKQLTLSSHKLIYV